MEGIIRKALSGFYYVDDGTSLTTCRGGESSAMQGHAPGGDRVEFTPLTTARPLTPSCPAKPVPAPGGGQHRPAGDRGLPGHPGNRPFPSLTGSCHRRGNHCESIVRQQVRPTSGGELAAIYERALPDRPGERRDGEGLDRLRELISGKVSAFTGNSGVGKSSILNALEPGVAPGDGDVSEKLGRGRHTTRHVELIRLSCGAMVADTPGFSLPLIRSGWSCAGRRSWPDAFGSSPLPGTVPVFRTAPISRRRASRAGGGKGGEISKSRHASYARLYEQASRSRIGSGTSSAGRVRN